MRFPTLPMLTPYLCFGLVLNQAMFANPTELASVETGFCTTRHFTRNQST